MMLSESAAANNDPPVAVGSWEWEQTFKAVPRDDTMKNLDLDEVIASVNTKQTDGEDESLVKDRQAKLEALKHMNKIKTDWGDITPFYYHKPKAVRKIKAKAKEDDPKA